MPRPGHSSIQRRGRRACTRRTPGFTGWQHESWLHHYGDGAAPLGPAGYRDAWRHARVVLAAPCRWWSLSGIATWPVGLLYGLFSWQIRGPIRGPEQRRCPASTYIWT
ncbi:CbrC family protein [Micromonospora saelicesensis]|uniref:CbrC family protein n=1 Tax=Micromonospora saelicesensis TaxID=285676 RepID=UPI003D8DA33D